MPSKLTGMKEMQAMLTALPAELVESIALSALRVGANIVAEEAKTRAPVAKPNSRNRKRYGLQAGALRDSIRVTRGVVSDGVARVSVLVGTHRKNDSNVYYAKMVEFGTAPHWIHVAMLARPGRVMRSRGGRPGEYRPWSLRTMNKSANREGGSLKIGQNFVGQSVMHPGARPRPFLRPAMDTMAQAAHTAIADQLRKKLQRIGRNSANEPAMKEAA